jgi:hypothetical protein
VVSPRSAVHVVNCGKIKQLHLETTSALERQTPPHTLQAHACTLTAYEQMQAHAHTRSSARAHTHTHTHTHHAPPSHAQIKRIDEGGLDGDLCAIISSVDKSVVAVVWPTAEKLPILKNLAKVGDPGMPPGAAGSLWRCLRGSVCKPPGRPVTFQ